MHEPQGAGRALAMLRTAAGMRQRDVAERLGVGASSVARLEAAEVNPRLSTLLRYLDAIGRTLDDFARALEVSRDDDPGLPAATAPSGGEQDLTWVVRELLEVRREQARLAREFERFRDALTLKVLDLGLDEATRGVSASDDEDGPVSSDD